MQGNSKIFAWSSAIGAKILNITKGEKNMYHDEKICENILKRLDNIEASALYVYKRKGARLTHQTEFEAFLKGIENARQAVMIEMGIVTRK